MNTGSIIKELRKQAKLSQTNLAKACDITQAYLSQIESNKREPHISSLKKICEVLDIPLPVFFFLTIDEDDVPERKKETFRILFPSVKAFLVNIFPGHAAKLDA